MTLAEIVAAGNQLDADLEFISTIVNDPEAPREQVEQVMAHGLRKAAKLEQMSMLLSADCKCGHGPQWHEHGHKVCYRCGCSEWDTV